MAVAPRPTMSPYPIPDAWLAKRPAEAALEPALPIVDPHHHLWVHAQDYLLDELLADTGSGHNITDTVFLQCRSMYTAGASEEMAPLGETAFVNGVAAMSASGGYGKTRVCSGIVAYADLSLGAKVEAVLEGHFKVGGGRFKGIRNSSAIPPDDTVSTGPVRARKGLLAEPGFREGFARLAAHSLTFDAWMYFTQLPELVDLAKAFPGTTIVCNHVGGVLGIGSFAGKKDEVFATWKKHIQALAALPNVVMKLGGLGMHVAGFGFEHEALPPTSEQLAAAWKPYLTTCIEAFGVERCMYESNFPVDKGSCSYAALWNAFKRVSAGASAGEKAALFSGTARRVYRLPV